MTSNGPHRKHPKITKARLGHYARNEWAIYGTTCTNIESLAKLLIGQLGEDFPIAWIDADHQDHTQPFHLGKAEQRIRFHGTATLNSYDHKALLHPMDLALVNGNHYPAARQLVVIDSAKEASLLRRKDQLTQIDALILKNPDQHIYPFIEELLADYPQQPPVYQWEEIPLLAAQLKTQLEAQRPPLKALILAGGASQRMGQDKSQLVYYDDPHELHMAKLCQSLGLETYLSKRLTETDQLHGFPVLVDRFIGLGPFGAICSAFLKEPDTAWLVLACDLPFMDRATLEKLIAHRSPGHFATAIKSAAKEFPEPLVTIYEPKAYPRLLAMLTQGVTCARKFLINSHVQHLVLQDDRPLSNVNTPEEFSQVQQDLKK